MQKKKVSNKVYAVLMVLVITLLSSVCFGALQWSYLIECSHSLTKTKASFGRQALECYASAMVEPYDRAGVIILLQTIDEFGDWVTVTGWSDYSEDVAAVDEVYAVDDGSYRMYIQYTAYLPDDEDYEQPVEIHQTYSDIQVY